ncbi:MAG: sugar transferase, partial [bacterium]|nr:sugar transferase [bacterium]
MRTYVDEVQSPPVARPKAEVRARPVPPSWLCWKRATDLVISVAALVVAAPIVAAAAVAVMMVSPGSPIFVQERVGRGGRPFRFYKLRTMYDGAHLEHEKMRRHNEVPGPVLKIKRDPRLHSLGSFLRRTSIDELPQLWNVIKGEMSLVGPRPALPCEVEHYDAFARRRLTVQQGITCYWQANGRSSVTFDEWMALDNKYIDEWNPLVDLRIIWKTIPAVVRGDGA